MTPFAALILSASLLGHHPAPPVTPICTPTTVLGVAPTTLPPVTTPPTTAPVTTTVPVTTTTAPPTLVAPTTSTTSTTLPLIPHSGLPTVPPGGFHKPLTPAPKPPTGGSAVTIAKVSASSIAASADAATNGLAFTGDEWLPWLLLFGIGLIILGLLGIAGTRGHGAS